MNYVYIRMNKKKLQSRVGKLNILMLRLLNFGRGLNGLNLKKFTRQHAVVSTLLFLGKIFSAKNSLIVKSLSK